MSHVVTKGLDPNVPMKDSGIEWLGEIPAHWEIKRIKYLLNGMIDTEHKTAPFYPDGEYPVVRTSNIKGGRLVLDDAKYTDHEGFLEWTQRGIPVPGDILFTREASAGEACLVPEGDPIVVGQRTVWFRVNSALLDSRYGVWSIYGGIADEFIRLLSVGSTVPHFNMADIGNIPIMTPATDEQAEIANYLEAESGKLDNLVSQIESGIACLQEYRTALIAAAVTGKIDVREEI